MINTLKGFVTFVADILKDRSVLWGLAKNDFKAKFVSSFLGGTWAFIQPLVTLLVFWFVFQVGFKNPPVQDVPFIIWFAPAYLVWSFFSETLMSGTNCLIEYSYLVKKVNFRVSMLPLVKIISSTFVHVAFVVFICCMLLICNVPLSVFNFQVLYYFFCVCMLLVGFCWMLAAVAPFAKDVIHVVGVVIQIGFWLTPIFWSAENMDPWVQSVLKVNPMFYICQGYRDCFINHIWFWERGYINLFFWGETIFCFVAGAYLFRKLRPQFADVL